MNPEQEVRVEIIATNPALRLIAHLIAEKPDHQNIDLLQALSKDRTGLSAAQTRKVVCWLIRKGFLRQLTEDEYPRVKARYSFNLELKEKAMRWNCAPFGSIGLKILRATAETFNLPSSTGGNVVFWTWEDGNVFDHYGCLTSRDEALKVRKALDRYLKKYEAMTEEEFEKHRESHENFLWWGRLLDPYRFPLAQLRFSGTLAQHLRPPVCDCDQCTKFHDLAFTTLTNYFNYEKQEKEQIRLALKSLS